MVTSTKRTLLVTGGCGYVGSQSVVHFARDRGWRVVVVDDLSTGSADFAAHADRFVNVHLADLERLRAVLASERFDGVLHCAGKGLVPESIERPLYYFQENIAASVGLFELCCELDLPVVFSSSCTVYGEPDRVPITEDTPTRPISPYGFTKLACERALAAAGVAHGLRHVVFRYFNAAGADPSRCVGERDQSRSRLVPNLLLASEERPFRLYGDDYPTRDGTCIRDFVHTLDIARAHAAGFEHLWGGGANETLNLGGHGATVCEMIDAMARVSAASVPFEVRARRVGDPAALRADCARAKTVLGWTPLHSDVDTLLGTAYRWTQADRGAA